MNTLELLELFTRKTNQTGLYNIQSIDNISSIMKYGILSYDSANKLAHTSIAMNEVQSRRDKVFVPTSNLRLHEYASLYFDPYNPMLSYLRNQNKNICILKVDRSVLSIKGTVLADRNASSSFVKFYTPEIGLQQIDFKTVYARSWIDEDFNVQRNKKSIKCAEVLVPYSIPYRYSKCSCCR